MLPHFEFPSDQYLAIHLLLICFGCYLDLLLLWYLLDFHLISLRRVGSDDDVGYGQNQVTEEGLNNEGMPPSLIILILCLQNCIVFYGYYMHAFNLVASVSIDTCLDPLVAYSLDT